jgi:RNA polymerase sigma-70 factor (ECF subfamily)
MSAAQIRERPGVPEPRSAETDDEDAVSAWREDGFPRSDEEGPGPDMDPDASETVAAPRDALAPGREPDGQLAGWIDAIVARDEQALAQLYDATFSRVYGMVHRIVRNAMLTEEVVEDTYFQVWRQAVRFDPTRGAAITWLMSIARSRALDAIRREARFRHEELGGDDTAESAGDGSPGGEQPADELLEVARQHADLHKALMLLGGQPRQLVSLAFFRGLSHEEIAAQTRIPLGTVKSQIRRALITLRQVLGETDLARGASARLATAP